MRTFLVRLAIALVQVVFLVVVGYYIVAAWIAILGRAAA